MSETIPITTASSFLKQQHFWPQIIINTIKMVENFFQTLQLGAESFKSELAKINELRNIEILKNIFGFCSDFDETW